MKIDPRKYHKPQGERLCCIQCGRTCRTRTGRVAKIYATLTFTHKPYDGVIIEELGPTIICRVCLLRQGGLRRNELGGVYLYDSYSGQPFDRYGGEMWRIDHDDPWKE